MESRKHQKDVERLARRVLKLVGKLDHVAKSDFEAVLNEITSHVHRMTGIGLRTIRELTPKVLNDLPKEYGKLNPDDRSWEVMTAFLYLKYLQLLGKL